MADIIQFRPRQRFVGMHLRCPFCGGNDGYVNIGAQSWGTCDRHGLRWFMGANISDAWLGESPRDWTANAHYLDDLQLVYVDLAGRPDGPCHAPEGAA
jgi:hypothetical protein